jgi:hypothetical protein
MEIVINRKVNMQEGIEENHKTPKKNQTMASVGFQTF